MKYFILNFWTSEIILGPFKTVSTDSVGHLRAFYCIAI